MPVGPRVLQHEVRGRGEPIVLVPGALTGWLSWVPHAERLVRSHQVVRVQPIHNELGSAGQRGDPSYTTVTERESLKLTLDSLGIGRCDLAGWSGGGRALIEFALSYPDRVRTLTLVEPASYWILASASGGADAADEDLLSFTRDVANRDVSPDDLARFLRLAGFVGPHDDPREHPNWERWLPHRHALSWQAALEHPDRTVGELARLRSPTLLVKGTQTAPWLKRVVDELAARLPHATVSELEGDHACHIQSIDAFLEAFLAHVSHGD